MKTFNVYLIQYSLLNTNREKKEEEDKEEEEKTSSNFSFFFLSLLIKLKLKDIDDFYHTAIEYENIEYFFGDSPNSETGDSQSQSRVYEITPNSYYSKAKIRKTLVGRVQRKVFYSVLQEIRSRFEQSDYSFFFNNCNHFTNEFILRLNKMMKEKENGVEEEESIVVSNSSSKFQTLTGNFSFSNSNYTNNNNSINNKAKNKKKELPIPSILRQDDDREKEEEINTYNTTTNSTKNKNKIILKSKIKLNLNSNSKMAFTPLFNHKEKRRSSIISTVIETERETDLEVEEGEEEKEDDSCSFSININSNRRKRVRNSLLTANTNTSSTSINSVFSIKPIKNKQRFTIRLETEKREKVDDEDCFSEIGEIEKEEY